MVSVEVQLTICKRMMTYTKFEDHTFCTTNHTDKMHAYNLLAMICSE